MIYALKKQKQRQDDWTTTMKNCKAKSAKRSSNCHVGIKLRNKKQFDNHTTPQSFSRCTFQAPHGHCTAN